jgi:hypothetical protein
MDIRYAIDVLMGHRDFLARLAAGEDVYPPAGLAPDVGTSAEAPA